MIRREVGRDEALARGLWHAGALNNGLIFGATYYGCTWLPRWCSYALGYVSTWLAFHLLRDGTDALVDNFRCVRPADSERELRRLALLTYRSYAFDTIDFIRSLAVPPDWFEPILAGHAERLAQVFAQGRGVIIVGGHFGNWELGGIVLRLLSGRPISVVGRPEPSPVVGEFRRRMRDRFGIETVEIGHMLETALRLRRLLGSNGIVAMLIDRHLGRDRLEVNLFGRPAFFLKSPALIASLSGAPMLPASMIRQRDGHFVGWFGDPVFVDAKASGEEGLRRATQAIASQLEAQIRKNPHLWYQFYPYWRAEVDEPPVTGSSG